MGIPPGAVFQHPPLAGIVHIDQPEALSIATVPLEVIRQRPVEEAPHIGAFQPFPQFPQIPVQEIKPALAVQMIFSFVESWNNDFLPALLLDKAEMKTVPIMIAQLRAADYSKFDLGKVYMLILLAILPVLVVYLFLSKSIIKGVTAGSVKG